MLNTIERDILVRQDHSSFDQISYVQGTNDIPIIFHIQDYELESGTAARVYVRRPDGTAEYDIATVNGNDITVDVKTSMFSVVGDNMLQVNLFKGEDKLATFAITVHVKKNYAYCTIKSENVTDIFDQTLAKMEEATGKANTAAQNIQEKAERGDFTSTIRIGEVTTGEPGSQASASNSGTDKDAVIDLTIPQGYQGVSMRMAGAWVVGKEYVNNTSYIDLVTYNGGTYGCKQTHTASEETAPPFEGNEYWQVIAKKGDTGGIENIDTTPIEFEEAEERENIESGDPLPKGLGKIRKWFSDLRQAAFMNVVNGVTQSVAGQAVLDAAVGKYLDEKKLDISRIVANRNITELGFAMDGKTAADWLNELNGKKIDKNDINKKVVVTEGYLNISVGDDLKDISYTTPGSYLCASNATAQAVKNCPLTSAFILVVQYVGSTNTMQTFYEYKGLKVIRRVYYGTAKDWGTEQEYIPTSQWTYFAPTIGTDWLTGMLQALKQATDYTKFEYSHAVSHEGVVYMFKRTNSVVCGGIFVPGAGYGGRVYLIRGIPNESGTWEYKEIL